MAGNFGSTAPIEPVLDWSGPVDLEPAVFATPETLEAYLGDPGMIAEAAVWVTAAVSSGLVGNAAYDAVKVRVVGFLSGWRNRQGRAKLDELKKKVLDAFADGKADKAEVKRRIDELFNEADC